MDAKIMRYVPKSKQAAIYDAYKDQDGYWIVLVPGYKLENYYADRVIHEDTIAALRAAIACIVKIDDSIDREEHKELMEAMAQNKKLKDFYDKQLELRQSKEEALALTYDEWWWNKDMYQPESNNETWQFYNPHPNGKMVGDCVKRSITKVTGWEYQEVQRTLNRIKREVGAMHYNSDATLKAFIQRMGWQRTTFPAVKGKKRMSGESFCQEHPKGKFILQMAGHWTACVNGVIYDTWDCRDKCVYSCYRCLEV